MCESNYSPSSYGWIVGQTRLFNLGWREGKLWIQTCLILVKIDFVSHPACAGCLGEYIYVTIVYGCHNFTWWVSSRPNAV